MSPRPLSPPPPPSPPSPSPADEPGTAPLLPSPDEAGQRPKYRSPPTWVVVTAVAFVLCAIVDLGAYMAAAPSARIYEANLCQRHYARFDPTKIRDDGTVDEKLCKIDPVQDKLAMIVGWQELWDSIPGILLAVPYGALADRYGRKWFLCLALAGVWLSLLWTAFVCSQGYSLYLNWFSAAFLCLGGGPVVLGAMGVTMISDLAPPEKRTTMFLSIGASVLLGELLGPIASSALMKRSEWLAFGVALAIIGFVLLLTLLLPETLHRHNASEQVDAAAVDLEMPTKDNGHGLKAQLRHVQEAVRFVKRDATLALIIFSFLANRFATQSMALVLRYASKRYGWELRQANFLLSFRAAANLFAILVLIPGMSAFFLKYLRLSPQRSDLWIARIGIVATAISFSIIALAWKPGLLMLGLLVNNLGVGYGAAIRSIAIFMVGGQTSSDLARLQAVMAVMEGVGQLLAGPVLATLFRWGIQLGGMFLGLPFFVAAMTFVCIAIITFAVSVRDISAAQAANENAAEDGHGALRI